jgi:hypothetical protein
MFLLLSLLFDVTLFVTAAQEIRSLVMHAIVLLGLSPALNSLSVRKQIFFVVVVVVVVMFIRLLFFHPHYLFHVLALHTICAACHLMFDLYGLFWLFFFFVSLSC